MRLNIFEEKIKYKFKNKQYLITALTHSSYANDNKTKSYERLEFLGDSILSFVISDYLFSHFPVTEGKLSIIRSRIVCENSLAAVAESLDFGDYINVSNSLVLENNKISKSILADVVEAVIAAIYLDGNLQEASEFIMRNLKETINQAVQGNINIDYKTKLQERIPKSTIRYEVVKELTDENSRKLFEICLYIDGNEICHAVGKSIKAATFEAAKKAFDVYLDKK